jgi:hypothetical protein
MRASLLEVDESILATAFPLFDIPEYN